MKMEGMSVRWREKRDKERERGKERERKKDKKRDVVISVGEIAPKGTADW